MFIYANLHDSLSTFALKIELPLPREPLFSYLVVDGSRLQPSMTVCFDNRG